MKRVLASLVVAGAAFLTAQPATADPIVVWCGFTPPVPCGVCVIDESGICVYF